MLKIFIPSLSVSVVTLFAVFMWGGFAALFLALVLVVLEVTLSFDNAIINAKVLAKMSAKWQQRFLTWGILIAVFGTRLVLPLCIVSAAAMLSPFAMLAIAFDDPKQYAALLETVRPAIGAFGGSFLLMVALKYFFNEAKSVHWILAVERHFARWGRIEAIEIALALVLLLGFSFALPELGATILSAGIIGIILFILIEGLAGSFDVETQGIARNGIVLFLYLNVLDSAFSLDGVVGAFALTAQLPIIAAGLGVGALFVRTFTVYLVRQKTLQTLLYLEHGAHWAILGLAGSMFAGLIAHVPEVVTGGIGLVFIALAYVSSRRRVVGIR